MALFKKKDKPTQEPQYYLSALNTEVLNYKVYILSKKEKLLINIIAFIVGAAVGYLFYGGIGKDANNHPTVTTHIVNVVVMVLVGFVATRIFVPAYVSRKIDKRRDRLRLQFIDLLDSLATSISSGKNVPNSLISAREDLLLQYSADSYIVKELDVINFGIENNIPIEELLVDLGNRSGIDDIADFGLVFQTVYRKGGNIKETIVSCRDLISEKIEIELNISTKVASAKNEQSIMTIMPILLVGMIKMMGSDFARNFTTPTGIISTTIAVALFVASYFVGRKIMKIEV